MKVAVTDYNFPDLSIEETILAQVGCTIAAGQCRTAQELIELTADADYVITQFAPVDRLVIAAMRKAKVIVRYGIGVDNVDLNAARCKGIPVCNVPDYCIGEVADQTVCLMLALTRQLLPNAMLVRDGGWGLGAPLERMRVLKEMVTGIIGFGRIGRQVARRVRAFGGRVLVFDPLVTPSIITAEACEPTSVDQLFTTSDLISLHCPCTEQTAGIINRESLAKMKPGVLLVNVGRGRLIDTNALVEACERGHVAGAGLDVTDPEPPDRDHPLRKMKEMILTSHIASFSPAAIRRLRESAANLIVQAISGSPPQNVVNDVRFNGSTSAAH